VSEPLLEHWRVPLEDSGYDRLLGIEESDEERWIALEVVVLGIRTVSGPGLNTVADGCGRRELDVGLAFDVVRERSMGYVVEQSREPD